MANTLTPGPGNRSGPLIVTVGVFVCLKDFQLGDVSALEGLLCGRSTTRKVCVEL